MRLATILDRATARAAGVPDAVADLVVPQGAPTAAIASIASGNPLDDDWFCPLDLPGDGIVSWSGTLADELFGDEPRTWMGEGHQRFEGWCDDVRDALGRAGRVLLLRPHARHVLSDPQGTLDFLRRREGEPFGLALSPADLLLPSMMPDAEDHFARILEFMVPRAALVLLQDARPAEGDEDRMEPCPLGTGILPPSELMAALADGLPEDAWVVVHPQDVPTAVEWRHGDLPTSS